MNDNVKVKVICTVGDGISFFEGEVYEANYHKDGYGPFKLSYYSFYKGGIPLCASFISLAEYREKRLNEILNDTL